MTIDRTLMTSSHWGTFRVEVQDGRVHALNDFEEDVDPSPIGHGIVDVLDGPTRITAPMVRKSWLENGPGSNNDKRGEDPFVEVSWEHAEQLVADELIRITSEFGNQAIYAGSYGWASAGRFHHAQSQLKRFLNCIGGYTASANTYSYAAAEVLVPHVLGTFQGHLKHTTSWKSIAENAELFVAFGGVPLKNGQIAQGGVGCHVQKAGLLAAHEAGVEFVNISPLRNDMMDKVNAQWLAPRPSSDVALMLALAHTLINEGLHNKSFLDRYTVGFDRYVDYLVGATDGIEKSADWASNICQLPADSIKDLARRMATNRNMISVSWSMTRQDHGEQPYWAAIALASMIGQIGLPGTGIGFGYSATNMMGMNQRLMNYQAFPQGQNPVKSHIPVARITDMLETPGETFDFNGKQLQYPDIRLIWWAGGNPFHHHQDLNRLRKAWQKPDTIIANEWCWNALARHADIVLPCTTTLERSDIALSPKDPYIVAMDQAIDPVGKAKDDHDIFAAIASKMDVEQTFTEGRTPLQWQRWMYDKSRQSSMASNNVELPDWQTLQQDGWCKIPDPEQPTVMMQEFRTDPKTSPLATPSGKIEIFSDTIATFDYDDCPGHPAWLEPAEWLGNVGKYPLHMISNQPHTKLHSQLDHGSYSRSERINDREPVLMHPKDANERGLEAGQIVRIFNNRGACLAGLKVSDDIRPGVIQISTGAWYDPDGTTCIHGNPNVLSLDKGTSRLAQGPIALSCLVEVEIFKGELPQVTIYNQPEIHN